MDFLNHIKEVEWISASQYAKKYELDKPKLTYWLKKNFIHHQKKEISPGRHGYLIPDIEPKEHPNFAKKGADPRKNKGVRKPYTRKAQSKPSKERDFVLENRKKILKPSLDKFLEKADPGQMFFTSKELQKIIDVPNSALFSRWKEWGLRRYAAPAKMQSGPNKKGISYCYARMELVRFLSGEPIDPKEHKSIDMKMVGGLVGAKEDVLDGWYHYDEKKCYPMNGHGFLQWLKDKEVRIENKRAKKWVPIKLMDFQEEFIVEALKQKPDGDFWYNLVIACYERGEGKTMLIALITIFRFFNMFGEVINLASESKELASFIHYNLIKGIINNTPELKKTPGLSVQEKEIALNKGPGDPVCIMKAVPTSSGLLPGTTCAVFTELHKFKKRSFFIDFWSSTRATPNAMTLVDTTVAPKGHIVHTLWEKYCSGKDPLLFFSHKEDDIRNPETTADQLNSFRGIMLKNEYDLYFRNRWEDAAGGLFSLESIKKMSYAGIEVGGKQILGASQDLDKAIEDLDKLDQERASLLRGGISTGPITEAIKQLEGSLIKMDDLYSLPATAADFDMLQKMFGVSFMVGVGLDRSKMVGATPDNTVFSCVARGMVDENVSYYFLLDMFVTTKPTSMFLQDKLVEWEGKYGWIDKVAAEEYQSHDFHMWCEDNGYESEFISATFKKQEELFTLMWSVVDAGFLKSPSVPYYRDAEGEIRQGFTNKDDIFREELGAFVHDPNKKFFGALEKRKKAAPKDDTVYSGGWGIYACQGESLADIGARSGNAGCIQLIGNDDTIGNYED